MPHQNAKTSPQTFIHHNQVLDARAGITVTVRVPLRLLGVGMLLEYVVQRLGRQGWQKLVELIPAWDGLWIRLVPSSSAASTTTAAIVVVIPHIETIPV